MKEVTNDGTKQLKSMKQKKNEVRKKVTSEGRK